MVLEVMDIQEQPCHAFIILFVTRYYDLESQAQIDDPPKLDVCLVRNIGSAQIKDTPIGNFYRLSIIFAAVSR